MRDAASVITQATDGIGVKLAAEYEVSNGRMGEILGKDNPYPKTKVLIRRIGHVDKSANKFRVRLIKADMDAMFDDILCADVDQPCVRDLHKESFEAIDAQLENKSLPEQLKELRELASVVNQMIEGRERQLRLESISAA